MNEIFYEMFKDMPRQGQGKSTQGICFILEKRISRMVTKEIEVYEKFSDFYGYVFYIMKN